MNLLFQIFMLDDKTSYGGNQMMFKEIDALLQLVEERRPLPADLMQTVGQKFREEWTYHSNAIEGNTFTMQETAFFLREGLTVKGKSLREHLEIINHAEAIDFLEEGVKERELSVRLIKDFHALLFQGVRGISFSPGDYKRSDNHVLTLSGVIHHYIPALQVPSEMEALIRWYEGVKDRVHPIELAAVFHHKLTAIHPFTDGNGRVSRLQQSFARKIVRNTIWHWKKQIMAICNLS